MSTHISYTLVDFILLFYAIENSNYRPKQSDSHALWTQGGERERDLIGEVIVIYLSLMNARYYVFSRFAACFQQIRTLHGMLFNMFIHPTLRTNRLLQFI